MISPVVLPHSLDRENTIHFEHFLNSLTRQLSAKAHYASHFMFIATTYFMYVERNLHFLVLEYFYRLSHLVLVHYEVSS